MIRIKYMNKQISETIAKKASARRGFRSSATLASIYSNMIVKEQKEINVTKGV
jgi:hypothetical protein